MIDDRDLGFFANFLGIFIFMLVMAYHFVMADPKYEVNWFSDVLGLACFYSHEIVLLYVEVKMIT